MKMILLFIFNLGQMENWKSCTSWLHLYSWVSCSDVKMLDHYVVSLTEQCTCSMWTNVGDPAWEQMALLASHSITNAWSVQKCSSQHCIRSWNYFEKQWVIKIWVKFKVKWFFDILNFSSIQLFLHYYVWFTTAGICLRQGRTQVSGRGSMQKVFVEI